MKTVSSSVPVLLAGLSFLVIFLLSVGAYLSYQHSRYRKKLRVKIVEAGTGSFLEHPQEQRTLQTRLWQCFESLGKRLGPEKDHGGISRLRIRFLRAGLRRQSIPYVFYGVKAFLAIMLPLVFLALRISVFQIINPRMTFAVCTGLALAGYYLPDVWLRVKTSRRRRKIFEGLPDALDLLVVCVEAGMGVDAAINRVAEELSLSNRELSDELKLYTLEFRAGKTREAALRNLADRINLDDLRGLVMLLIQAERFGMSIAQSLRVFSDSFRTQRFQRAEEMAAKLPVKLVLPMMIFIFPTLFIVIMGPTAIRFWQIWSK